MNRIFISIITIISLSTVKAESSLNEELNRCSSMKRDLQRLACYDKLAGLASSSPIETLSEKSKTSLPKKNTDSVVTNWHDKAGKLTPNSTQVSSTSSSFGFSKKDNEPDSITSTIPGEFMGWKNGDKLKLANGQVWQIKDSSSTLYHKASNPKIIILKGLFGSFRIKLADLNKSVRVVRVK